MKIFESWSQRDLYSGEVEACVTWEDDNGVAHRDMATFKNGVVVYDHIRHLPEPVAQALLAKLTGAHAV